MILQFAPLSSLTHPTFWHKLTALKLDVLKLSDESVDIVASSGLGRILKDRETGSLVGVDGVVAVGEESFQATQSKLAPFTVPVKGTLKNYNTIEEFKAADKSKLFNEFADSIWDSITTTRSIARLNDFMVITFADLKKYKYFYWFAFPAFSASPGWDIPDSGLQPAQDELDLKPIWDALRAEARPYFLVVDGAVKPIEEYGQHPNAIVGFLDPSTQPQNPGWPLRNLLAYLLALHTVSSVRILCWRDSEVPRDGVWHSRYAVVSCPEQKALISKRPGATGWEKNPQGKLGPRLSDLSAQMDPTILASQAVNLNLSLMRWRILPALDLSKIAETKCLLLGAGTLGCSVARTLMGWGVKTIRFVDYGRVSYSNPVRQSLFRFEDAVGEGRDKAECAAERCKEVWPGVDVQGHTISIPMPGHPISDSEVEKTKKDVERLEALVDEADVVYLLMDSRESRWLPTVLGRAKGKLVLNAALGFDTFLVMRHGARNSKPGTNNDLGCYYCNDIVAPTDSLSDRTLDQMCTVTRPGIASIASSTAVELMVSVLQHPDGIHAPAPPVTGEPNGQGESILGLVPHQLRGYLAQFRNVPVVGARYDRCTGCSETVLEAYKTEGFEFMKKAFNDGKYLEKLTGLDKMYAEAEKAMDDVEWLEGEDGEDDF